MLNLVTSALAFNGPSTVLTTTKRAPSASMAGSLEYDFVYGSAAGNAKPMGYGKHDSDILRLKPVSAGSLEHDFVYGSAAGNAKPMGYGKHDSDILRLKPASAGSLEHDFVYGSAAGNAKPMGYGKHDSDTLKLKSASAYASQFSKFAYDSAALGDGKGDVPLTPTTTGKVVPAALPIPSLEQEFVYAQSAGNAVPLGAGKGN